VRNAGWVSADHGLPSVESSKRRATAAGPRADGLFIARAVEFVDVENVATKVTATTTEEMGLTAADTNAQIELDTFAHV